MRLLIGRRRPAVGGPAEPLESNALSAQLELWAPHLARPGEPLSSLGFRHEPQISEARLIGRLESLNSPRADLKQSKRDHEMSTGRVYKSGEELISPFCEYSISMAAH